MKDNVKSLIEAKVELEKAQRDFRDKEQEFFENPENMRDLLMLGVVKINYTQLKRRM